MHPMHPMFYTANSGLCNYVLFLQIRSHFRSKNQCSDYFKLEKLVLGGIPKTLYIAVFSSNHFKGANIPVMLAWAHCTTMKPDIRS